ncbi:MAG: Mov34/MPN/PAD-1 family protein [Dehalococcoidia bacterium]|nr:Mov34/MPN/PAD-1 family protein [Dehalococcoidia bacterium]
MANFGEPLEIPSEILLAVYLEARAAFPAECCGWLTGPAHGGGVDAVRPAANDQGSGAHPTAAERTAETAYVFNSTDLLELNGSLDSDTPARIIYHSHPNGRAYLSDTDRTVATSPWGDGPAYPVQQLVVGINGDRVIEAALFDWDEDAVGFVEMARFAGADI